jgi:hypothetical protein
MHMHPWMYLNHAKSAHQWCTRVVSKQCLSEDFAPMQCIAIATQHSNSGGSVPDWVSFILSQQSWTCHFSQVYSTLTNGDSSCWKLVARSTLWLNCPCLHLRITCHYQFSFEPHHIIGFSSVSLPSHPLKGVQQVHHLELKCWYTLRMGGIFSIIIVSENPFL